MHKEYTPPPSPCKGIYLELHQSSKLRAQTRKKWKGQNSLSTKKDIRTKLIFFNQNIDEILHHIQYCCLNGINGCLNKQPIFTMVSSFLLFLQSITTMKLITDIIFSVFPLRSWLESSHLLLSLYPSAIIFPLCFHDLRPFLLTFRELNQFLKKLKSRRDLNPGHLGIVSGLYPLDHDAPGYTLFFDLNLTNYCVNNILIK